MEYYVPRYVTEIEKTDPRDNVRRVSIHAKVISVGEEAFCDWVNLCEIVFEKDNGKEN